MARDGGFFGRLGRAIARIISPSRRPQPPPEPPQAPTGRGSPFREIFDDDVSRRITREVSGKTGYSRNEQYQLHIELFFSTYMTELPQDEQLEAWEGYLKSFVTNTRPHSDWFGEWGMDPRDFDWEAWRHAMGYERRQ